MLKEDIGTRVQACTPIREGIRPPEGGGSGRRPFSGRIFPTAGLDLGVIFSSIAGLASGVIFSSRLAPGLLIGTSARAYATLADVTVLSAYETAFDERTGSIM